MAEGKKGFFGRLVEGLAKTRNNIVSGIDSIFSGFSAIDDDFYEEIEETLIMGDLGIQTTMSIVEDLRAKVKEQHIKEPEECKELLISSIKQQMDLGENAYEFEHRKSVVLVIGVNGVGKTTSVGKLAGQLKDSGHKVILAAADTFRAAAIEQLTEWAGRAGVDIIAQQVTLPTAPPRRRSTRRRWMARTWERASPTRAGSASGISTRILSTSFCIPAPPLTVFAAPLRPAAGTRTPCPGAYRWPR